MTRRRPRRGTPSLMSVVALSLVFLVGGAVIFAASYYMRSGSGLGYHSVPVSLAKALSPLFAGESFSSSVE